MKTLIKNCNIIDGIAEDSKKGYWVLLEGNRIADIGSCAEENIPAADEVINADGRYLLPGLVNLHVHIQRRHLHCREQGIFRQGAPYIENSPDAKRMVWAVRNAWDELRKGVTTIRDVASKNRVNNLLRDIIKEGIIRGPRVIAAGFGIAVTGGHETHRYQGAVEADGPDEIRKAVRMEIKMGAEFIKFMGSGGLGGMPEHEHPSWEEITLEELKAGIEEAHNRGKTTTIHAMGTGPVLKALYAGIDGIEHGTNLNDEALDIMSQRKVYLVPTISGITAVAEREEETGSVELAKLIRELVCHPHRESVYKAYKRGILIGAGTDTLGEMIRELEILHECGISKMDCIKAATSSAARICGKEQELGTVEKGKSADLLIVDGNPTENLAVLRKVYKVIKDGEVVTTEWMCRF